MLVFRRIESSLIRHPLFLISVFLFMGVASQGQYSFNDRCTQAYEQILNFRFEPARQLLQDEKREHPDNLIPVFLENYIDFFTLFTSENRLLFEQRKQNKSIRLQELEEGDKYSPYYRFCIAGVKLQWALIRSKFGEYTTAGFEVRSAFLLLEENNRMYPGFLPNNIGLGILHVVLGLVPENYQWLTKLVGLEGSVSDGVMELQEVLDYSGNDRVYRLFKPEACFYLAFIDINILNRKEASLSLLEGFQSDSSYSVFQSSPLLVFARSSILMRAGKNDKVIDLLSQVHFPPDAYPFAYLNYMQGLARLQALDFSALTYFDTFLASFQGINYIKSAHQKLAWCYLLQGDTAAYLREIELAGKRGYAIVDEDKQAYSEQNVAIIPAIPLLKARLLYDGGYYRQALRELLNTPLDTYIRNRKDLTEYTYRMARIYHGLGDEKRAIELYTKTVELGRNLPHYFAANAALNLGLIYESKGDALGADTNFRICASLKHDEYENSLRQKAKAGLNRLKRVNP